MTIEASLKTMNETLLRIEELLKPKHEAPFKSTDADSAAAPISVIKQQASTLPDAPFQEEEATPCPLTNANLVAKYAQQAHKSFNPEQVQHMMLVFTKLNAIDENGRPALRFLQEANYSDFYEMIEVIKAGG